MIKPAISTKLMASKEFRAAVILFLLSSYLSSIPVGASSSSLSTKMLRQGKMVIGSRPPSCMNKCSSCRPCAVTLVTPPHRRKNFIVAVSREDEERYYLLSWRCRCGNKLFNP